MGGGWEEGLGRASEGPRKGLGRVSEGSGHRVGRRSQHAPRVDLHVLKHERRARVLHLDQPLVEHGREGREAPVAYRRMKRQHSWFAVRRAHATSVYGLMQQTRSIAANARGGTTATAVELRGVRLSPCPSGRLCLLRLGAAAEQHGDAEGDRRGRLVGRG